MHGIKTDIGNICSTIRNNITRLYGFTELLDIEVLSTEGIDVYLKG